MSAFKDYSEEIDSTLSQIRNALSMLLGSQPGSSYVALIDNARKLDSHPFDLEHPTKHNDGDESPHVHEIYIVGEPGGSSSSVKAMTDVIRAMIVDLPAARRPNRYLRIIEAKTDVYYEIGTFMGVFICGGCNLYSGEGGRARQKIRSLFQLASLLWEEPILRYVLHNGESAKKVRNELDR
jgi:hypothetical protein